MADNIPLSISWSTINDYFMCPVCMSDFRDTLVTRCGHRYCATCIRECIDIHHKCPCCNKVLSPDDLIKDHQIDELLHILQDEKAKSEKEYFETLISEVILSKDHDPIVKMLSPVGHVLKEHLKKTFSSYEKYYQELKEEFTQKITSLEKELEAGEKRISEQSVNDAELNQRIERLRNGHRTQTELLEKDLEIIGNQLAESFDNYLDEHIPDLSIIPVNITLSILNKSLQLANVTIKPRHSIEDIKNIFRHQMEIKGNKIVEFGDDLKFLCFRPSARRDLYEMHRIAEDIVERGASHKDIIVLPSDCLPVLHYHLQPGSEIAIFGQVVCESDLPKRCFAVTYKSENPSAIDYFTCKDCKINWICRSCMEVCHKGHNVAPYIMNHRPTWPCCYCAKKKKCTIQQ